MGEAMELALRYLAAINKRDVQALKDCWDDHGLLKVPGRTLRRPDAIAGFFHAWWEAFPDERLSVETVFDLGNRVVIEAEFRGTQTGTLRGLPCGDLPPTDRQVTFDLVGVHETSGGKLISERLYFDVFDILTQLKRPPAR